MIVDVSKIERELDAHRGRIEKLGPGKLVIVVTSRGGVSLQLVEHLPPTAPQGDGPTHVGADPQTSDFVRT